MQHSTGYIIGFAAAICLVASLFVAGSAVGLKDRQDLLLQVEKLLLVRLEREVIAILLIRTVVATIIISILVVIAVAVHSI